MKISARRRSKRGGFSFLDVVFGMFLVAASASIMVATMPFATVSRARANLSNKAAGLAQKELEAIRGMGYANADGSQLLSYGLIDGIATDGNGAYSFTNSDYAAFDSPARILPGGTGSVLVEQVDIDLRRVTVTVNYNDKDTQKSVVVGTLIANL